MHDIMHDIIHDIMHDIMHNYNHYMSRSIDRATRVYRPSTCLKACQIHSLVAIDGCRESADREGTICTAMRDSIVPNHKTPDRGRATSAPVHAGHQ